MARGRRSAPSRLALRFIATYQADVGPRLPDSCRFTPSCSEYGRLAFERYGFLTATRKVAGRLSRCRRSYRGPLVDHP